MELDLGNGIKVCGLSEKDVKFLSARHAFVEQYCKAKGWDADDLGKGLTIEQILEIRSQEGWKNPLGDSND